MKTDRELLELAAKAAGIELHRWMGDLQNRYLLSPDYESGLAVTWNPLTDDGDALRLACFLELDLNLGMAGTIVYMKRGTPNAEEYSDDYMNACRRAIVRAAAAIGKAMQ